MARFNAVFNETTNIFNAEFEGAQTFTAKMNTVVKVMGDVYTGIYEFTPTQETQVIGIKNKQAIADIVINPIPNNYGLITWNGSTLTVS